MNPDSRDHLLSQEPDFDALHGVSLDDPNSPFKLYYNRSSCSHHTNKVLLTHFPVLVAVSFATMMFVVEMSGRSVIVHELSGLIAFSLGVPMFSVMAVGSGFKRLVNQQSEPIVELNESGLTTRLPTRRFNNIPWHNITGARIKKEFGVTMIAVDVDSSQCLHATASTEDQNSSVPISTKQILECNERFYKFFKAFIGSRALLNIPAFYLPIEPELLAEQINMRCGVAKALPDAGNIRQIP